MAEHDDAHEPDDDTEGHDHDEVEELESALELDSQSQIFLEMRRQNLDLLKIAVEAAGYGGTHPPVKHGDVKHVIDSVWKLYAEFYSWVDPEESEGDEEDEDEDDQ